MQSEKMEWVVVTCKFELGLNILAQAPEVGGTTWSRSFGEVLHIVGFRPTMEGTPVSTASASRGIASCRLVETESFVGNTGESSPSFQAAFFGIDVFALIVF